MVSFLAKGPTQLFFVQYWQISYIMTCTIPPSYLETLVGSISSVFKKLFIRPMETAPWWFLRIIMLAVMFVVGPQPLVSQIGKLVITWMIQTTPYGRRKKGPWSVLNRDSETKAVLYFSHHQFYKHWSCCPNLESRIMFSELHHHQYRKHSSWWQQLSKPWVKDVVFRINKDVGGKGADSNEERSTVPHQVLSSKKFHQFCQWSILVIITSCDDQLWLCQVTWVPSKYWNRFKAVISAFLHLILVKKRGIHKEKPPSCWNSIRILPDVSDHLHERLLPGVHL